MKVRVVAHAPTVGMRDLTFGDRSSVARPDLVTPWSDRLDAWLCGPEPACCETADLLGGSGLVVADLAAPYAGLWAGRSLGEVQRSDPLTLHAWLRDPHAAPPGGETWVSAIRRIGAAVDAQAVRGSTALVVTGLAARAIAAYALGAGPGAVFACDVAPLSSYVLSGGPGAWRVRLGSGPDRA